MISLGNFTANGPGNDEGNVAVASGSATINNPFSIGGKLYLGPGVSYSSNVTPGGGVVTGSSVATDAASAASKAASEFSAMKATQTVGTLGNNSTITGTSGLNVIDASGVNVTNGTVTLSGSSSSVFVINVSGDFNVSNGGVTLSGGVSESNVVWNISGNLTITGGGPATFYGFALDPGGQVTVHDDTWYGEVIGGTITDTIGFTVVPPPPPPPPSTGSLRIHKNAPSDSQHTVFTFDINCGSAGSFTRTVTGTGNSKPVTGLAVGTTCKVHEVPLPGFVVQPDQTVTISKAGVTVTVTFTNRHTPPHKKGYLEICKQAQGSGLDHDVFTFSVQGKDYMVPVGACSPSFQVTAGNVTVTEVSRAGPKLVSVSTIPANRLISDNLSARTAVVKVVPGNVSTETIVTFTNKSVPGSGRLKICKVAGAGITVGTDFSYTVGSQSVTVPAGPAPGGYCEIVGKFKFGTQTITEKIPAGDSVSSIVVAPTNRLVSEYLSTGTVTVDIGSGVTEATYTNTSGT
jgi:hypothetical protein